VVSFSNQREGNTFDGLGRTVLHGHGGSCRNASREGRGEGRFHRRCDFDFWAEKRRPRISPDVYSQLRWQGGKRKNAEAFQRSSACRANPTGGKKKGIAKTVDVGVQRGREKRADQPVHPLALLAGEKKGKDGHGKPYPQPYRERGGEGRKVHGRRHFV